MVFLRPSTYTKFVVHCSLRIAEVLWIGTIFKTFNDYGYNDHDRTIPLNAVRTTDDFSRFVVTTV